MPVGVDDDDDDHDNSSNHVAFMQCRIVVFGFAGLNYYNEYCW
jgi:hypothetical protein